MSPLMLFRSSLFLCLLISTQFCNGVDASVFRSIIRADGMQPCKDGFSVKNLPKGAGRYMEGSFKDQASLEKAVLSKKLDTELPAGKYVVLVRVNRINKTVAAPNAKTEPTENDVLAMLEGTDEDAEKPDPTKALIDISLGDSLRRLRVNRSQGSFTGAVIVDATKPFNEIRLSVKTVEPQIGIAHLYISDNIGDVTIGQDGASASMNQWLMASGHADCSDRKARANYIDNGSFEAGHGGYQWCCGYQTSHTVNPESVDSSRASHGRNSLRMRLYGHRYVDIVSPNNMIMHKLMLLKPNTEYFFRGVFRADSPVRVTCSVAGAYGDYRKTPQGSGSITVSKDWKPMCFEFATGSDPRGYMLRITGSSALPRNRWGEEQNLWIDELTLSESKPDGFVPAADIEYGLGWNVPGKIFSVDGEEQFKLLVTRYDQEKNVANLKLNCRVFDYYDRQVKSETVSLAVGSNGTVAAEFDPRTGKPGAFRLVVDGAVKKGGTETELPIQEYVFSVLPDPPEKMKGTLGAYINIQQEPLEIMSRAGVRRTTTLSSANERLSVWKVMEPEKGVFKWWDEHVALARKYGVEIIVNFEFQDPPGYALDPEDPDDLIKFSGHRKKGGGFSAKAMSDFVEKVVSHYKEDIHYWLMVDEPYHYFSMPEYFKIIKTASEAARKADPDCKVLMHGAYYAKYLKQLDKMGVAKYIDGVSGYARNPSQGAKLKAFREKHDLPILYTVEYSWQVSMYRTIYTPDSWQQHLRNPINYRDNGAYLAALPVKYMCWAAADGFNRYDARYPGGDFTQLDNYKCMFEYDGALKPSAVAYAMASQMLDGFKGVKQLDVRKDIQVFLLENDERAAIVFMLGNCKYATITPPQGVKILDIMGNPVRTAPLPALLTSDVNYVLLDKSDDLREKVIEMLKGLDLKDPVDTVVSTRLDEASGQYVMDMEVKNLLPDETVNVDCVVGGPLEEFWKISYKLNDIKPGATSTLSLGLNRCKGDKLPAVPCTIHLLVRALDSSGIVVKKVDNVFQVGE